MTITIPDHVAAYAIGLRTASGAPWRRVAELVKANGLGDWPAADLKAAGWAWAAQHVERGAVRRPPRARRQPKKGPPPTEPQGGGITGSGAPP